jgi:DNA-binding transcriptional LysR family regulator
MRRIDPYTLRLLVAVANARSIASAAAKEHIAPSALSRRIADLESALRVPLLVRSPHGITLTEAGTVAVRRARDIETHLQSLVREVQGHAGRIAGTVRLYACPAAVVGQLPERLKRFLDQHREVRVTLHDVAARDVIRACLDDQADVGITEATNTPGTMEAWYFASDPLVVTLPEGNGLTHKSRLRLADVLAYPMVTVHPADRIDRLLREHASKAARPMRECFAVKSFDAASRIVEAGFGVAVMPKRAADIYTAKLSVVTRPLREDWARDEQRIYSLRKSPRPRAVAALIEALRA